MSGVVSVRSVNCVVMVRKKVEESLQNNKMVHVWVFVMYIKPHVSHEANEKREPHVGDIR